MSVDCNENKGFSHCGKMTEEDVENTIKRIQDMQEIIRHRLKSIEMCRNQTD